MNADVGFYEDGTPYIVLRPRSQTERAMLKLVADKFGTTFDGAKDRMQIAASPVTLPKDAP